MRRGTTRFGVVVSALTVALLLLGLATPVLSARAQSGDGLISDTEYESPQFDFSLEWDNPWSLSADSVDSQANKLDTIQLESGNALVQIVLLFPTDDPRAYLDVLVQGAQDGATNFEQLGDDSGTGYISATVSFTLDTQSGALDVIEYMEVGEIDAREGSDTGLFTATFLAVASEFESEWGSLNDAVARDGRDPLFLGTPEGIAGGSQGREQPTPEPTEESSNRGNRAAGGIDGNTFTGPLTGFSVEWDDRMWKPTDLSDRNGDGVELESDTARIQLITAELPGGDVKSCVTDAADAVKQDDGVSNFKRASRLDPPEAPRGAFGRLYTYDVENNRGSDTFVHYIECRPLAEDTYLVIAFITGDADYEDEVDNFLDVTDTISLEPSGNQSDEPTPEPTEESGNNGGLGRLPSNNDEPTPEPNDRPAGNGLEGNTYSGRDFAFSATWDDRTWEAEELEPDTGYEGLKLTNDNATIFIEAITSFDGDPATCVTATGEGRADIDGVSNVRKSTRLEMPKTDRDAEAAVYTYTYAGSNGDVDFAEYIECRPLDEAGSVLRITALALADVYESQVPDVEDVLAGIEVGGGASTGRTSGNTSGNNTTNNGSSGDLPGVSGSEYQSPRFDFTLSWGNDWEPVSATDEEGGTTLLLSNGVSTAFIFGGDFDRDPETCVQQIAGVVEAGDGVSNFNIVTNEDGEPQSGASRTSGYGFYSLTKNGDDYFDYIYCQPASDDRFVVVVVYEMPVTNIATELQNLDDLLSNLEVA